MSTRYLILFFLIASSAFLFNGCKTDSSDQETKSFEVHQSKIKEQFIKANQQVIIKENDEMDFYQKSHQQSFIKTNSGIRYYVYKPSIKGDSIKDGDIIKINYNISLLEGTECYSSKIDGTKEMKVGMENVESGLHKAVLYLKSGDKAFILLPSYLAHGLLGDSKKIPPQSPILYDLEIVDVKTPSKK